MHQSQHRIAGGNVVHQHPQRAQVVEFLDRQRLALHLLPDAVDMLGPAGHVGFDAVRRHRVAQLCAHGLDVALAAAAVVVQRLRDAQVVLGLQHAERQVLQLPLQLPDAEPVGQRRVNVARHPRQRTLLVGRQPPRRAHARELAGQHDRHHAQVAHQRQQQPAHAFGIAASAVAAVQRPHPARGALAFQQHVQALRHLHLRLRRQRLHIDQRIQQGGGQHLGVGVERDEDRQGVGQHFRAVAHRRARLGMRAPADGQRRRQGLGRHARQRVGPGDGGDGGNGHGSTVAGGT